MAIESASLPVSHISVFQPLLAYHMVGNQMSDEYNWLVDTLLFLSN
ncbi:hypothetical protein [Arsenophonus endosymbiont of Aleurodicus floccissimus]|nr:hypothetical protein [Arsenophonus endosymbiont of Aleurodicus floccissimus]